LYVSAKYEDPWHHRGFRDEAEDLKVKSAVVAQPWHRHACGCPAL